LESEEETQVRGPLGIWHFPLLNAFLRFLELLRRRRFSHVATGTKTPRIMTKNIEVWEWQDYKGRTRKIVARREVEELS